MSSGCISGCVNDAQVGAAIVGLRKQQEKWAEADAEFIKSVAGGRRGEGPRVVDSYSCRQLYLRSYTFSRKESVPEKTVKCFGRVKGKVAGKMKKVTHFSSSAFFSIFNTLLSCTTSIDVVDH